MSRWFRHYAGMMRDEKLVSAAVKSKQPVERVVWVYGAILESAAEIDDGGRYEFDAAEAAYFLRADEADICAVVDALTANGRLASGVVVAWSDRQYQSDKSASRQAAYRERKRKSGSHGDARQEVSDVTPPSRDGEVTAQETETDTETEAERERPRAPEVDPVHWKPVADILESRVKDVDDWELDFLHSIRWKPTLTKPQRDSLKGIQDKLGAATGPPGKLPTVKRGTPAYDAWIAHYRLKNGKAGFAESLEWLTVPTEFPPDKSEEAA